MGDGSDRSRTAIFGGSGVWAVPLVVAVTGHRDLVEAEVSGIRDRVREFLAGLMRDYPERTVTVMTPLAEGADQLAAEVAFDLGLPVIAPLPMSLELYLADFESADSKQRFQALLDSAIEVFELPLVAGNTAEGITADVDRRALQYAQLGVYLCAHCHILLALWDGKYTDRLGGTGQVVRFHHDDVMPGFTPEGTTSRLILTDDESDLVYHIVCSRSGPDGAPAPDLQPLSTSWFTSSDQEARTALIPDRYVRVLAHAGEFSRDAREHKEQILAEAQSLIGDDSAIAVLPPGIRDIDRMFRIADWLAIHFQKRVMFVLRITHVMALLMGVMYIAYSDVVPYRSLIVAFILFFVFAALTHKFGHKHAWHRKYLDYRALAEGLRVQFYWAAAGVTSGNESKFAHDNFLQSQDADLGWIRNVMRVAGMACDAAARANPAGLQYAIREWIGDDNSGQLGYYRRQTHRKLARNLPVERFAVAVVVVSFIAFALFIFASDDLADRLRNPIIVLMGVLLLVAGVRQSYAFSVADSELIKQYEFMFRTFTKAHRRIEVAAGDAAKRRVLKLLGDAALDEHSQWILMHRERAVDEGEIWRMTGG